MGGGGVEKDVHIRRDKPRKKVREIGEINQERGTGRCKKGDT